MSGQQQVGSRYVIESPLGRGMSGRVWEGRDVDGHRWAVKVLREELAEDPAVVRQFVQERSVLASIRHRHVVGVHDLVVEGSVLAIVMDLVDGQDMRSLLQARRSLTPSEVARWGGQIAEGLAAVHAAGVAHGDVKPENVLIEGSSGDARLTDFGVARLVGSAAGAATMVAGTPQYMAPEVVEGWADGTGADLYALGILLYELCCGVTPFAGRPSAWATMRAHADEVPGRPGGIPDELWSVIERLLAKDPVARPSAVEAARSLRAVVPMVAGIDAATPVGEPPSTTPAGEPLSTTPRPAADDPTMWGMARVPSVSAVPMTTPAADGGWGVPADAWEEAGESGRGRRRLVAGVAGAAAGLLVCAGIAGALLLGGHDEAAAGKPAPRATSTASPVVSATPLPAASGTTPALPPTALPGVATAKPSTRTTSSAPVSSRPGSTPGGKDTPVWDPAPPNSAPVDDTGEQPAPPQVPVLPPVNDPPKSNPKPPVEDPPVKDPQPADPGGSDSASGGDPAPPPPEVKDPGPSAPKDGDVPAPPVDPAPPAAPGPSR